MEGKRGAQRGDNGGSLFERHARVCAASSWAFTDGRGLVTSNLYDATDRLVGVSAPPVAAGQPRRLTQHTLDAGGRSLRVQGPDGTVVTNTYHASGRLKSRVWARDVETEYGYRPKTACASPTSPIRASG